MSGLDLKSNFKERMSVSFLAETSILLSFVVSFCMLYLVAPASFEATWVGRTFYLLFLWLFLLELILNREKFEAKLKRLKSARTAVFLGPIALPSIYVAAENLGGLHAVLTRIALQSSLSSHSASLLPLTTEYLVFAVF